MKTTPDCLRWARNLALLYLFCPAVLAASSGSKLIVQPDRLVFSAIAGQSCPSIQRIRLIAAGVAPEFQGSWTCTSKPSWLKLQTASGTVPGVTDLSVNTAGLAAGVYDGQALFNVAGLAQATESVQVTLIVNPSSRVRVSPWRDGKMGAASISVDDSLPTLFEMLAAKGVRGTYFFLGAQAPPYAMLLSAEGMELGCHTLHHICSPLAEADLRQELEMNIAGVGQVQPAENVLLLAWPCGRFGTLASQAVAAEYFLAARGYDINQLEEATPADFMNLKSFNSEENFPYHAEFASALDSAQAQGKWANLVLHSDCSDRSWFDQALTKDLWVAPIGSVVKYILQRDRLILSEIVETQTGIQFKFRKLVLAPTPKKDFEKAFNAEDLCTLELEITDKAGVSSVCLGTVPQRYVIRVDGTKRRLLVNLPATMADQTVSVAWSTTASPALLELPKILRFAAVQGSAPAAEVLTVMAGSGSLQWSAEGTPGAAWLTLKRLGDPPNKLSIELATAELAPGAYKATVKVTAPGAANSPQTIEVVVNVSPRGLVHYGFDLPDRASLLAAGWDFLAKKASGGVRNTEVNSDLCYDQQLHPGCLRLRCGDGDLWSWSNGSHNSLFRALPADWTSIRLKASFKPGVPWEQLGLIAYQDDDNYVSVERVCGNYGDELEHPANAMPTYLLNNRVGFAYEKSGIPNAGPTVSFPAVDFYLRLDRDPATETITGLYSLDGWSWFSMASVTQKLLSPRVAIVSGGVQPGDPERPNLDLRWVEVVGGLGLRTLTVTSVNPAAGVTISLNPPDNAALGGGNTPFARSYPDGTAVTATAPATFGSSQFQKWQTNGVDYTTGVTTSLSLKADTTLTAVYLPSSSPPPGGLVNGSFESDYAGWSASGNQGIGNLAPAADGAKGVVFNWGQTSPNGVLSQTFATLPGQIYDLTFDFGVLAFNYREQQLRVTVQGAGALLSEVFTLTGLANGSIRWSPQKRSFQANSTTTILTFQDVSASTDSLDLLLDNVRVVAEAPPEPSPLLNGSFENGYQSWNASGNQGVTASAATDGHQAVVFNWGQTSPNAALTQTFATSPNQNYTISFDFGVLSYNWHEQRLGLTLQGSGSLLSKTIQGIGAADGSVRWLPQSYSFRANSSQTTLTFRDLSAVTDSIDLLLDNVRIAAESGSASASIAKLSLNMNGQFLRSNQPLTLSMKAAPQEFGITFQAPSNGKYLLESSTDLRLWQTVREIVVTERSASESVKLDSLQSQRFYRIRKSTSREELE